MAGSDPSNYDLFLQWMEVNHVGDLSGVLGIVISIVGFGVTVAGVVRSQRAAEAAATAARETRDSVRLLDTVVEFSAAIAALEELKRLHREANWQILPDRYAHIRKLLATLRTTPILLTPVQKRVITQALINLRKMEDLVERHLKKSSNLDGAKLNRTITDDIDSLLGVFNDLKSMNVGLKNVAG